MRTSCLSLVAVAVAGLGLAVDTKTVKWDFEDATSGQLPTGWTAAKTGKGDGSVWKVVEDTTAPKGPNRTSINLS